MPHSAKSGVPSRKIVPGWRDCLRPRSEIRGKWLPHGESLTLSHQLFKRRPAGYDIGEVDAQASDLWLCSSATFVRKLGALPWCATLGRFIATPENVKATRGRQSPVGPQSP